MRGSVRRRPGSLGPAFTLVACIAGFAHAGCHASPPHREGDASVPAAAALATPSSGAGATSSAPTATASSTARATSEDDDLLSSAYAGPPPTASPELRARVQHLLDAIAQSEPDLGKDMLLPKAAYTAIAQKRDAHHTYESEVVVPYKKRVRALAKRRGLKDAKVGSLTMGAPATMVTRPVAQLAASDAGTNLNPTPVDTRPMWRAHRVQLTARGASGSTTYVIAEMIAYGGAWYVVRL